MVATRRPDNLNGWLFCAIGLAFSLEAAINEYVIAGALVVAGGLPLTAVLAWTLTWLWLPPFAMAVIFMPLYFPTGFLLSPRWHRVSVLGVVAVVAFGAALAFEPGPIQQGDVRGQPVRRDRRGTGRLQRRGRRSGGDPAGRHGRARARSQVVRFRGSAGDIREQIKWFALAVLVAGATFGTYLAISIVTLMAPTVKLLEILVVVSLLGVPAAAGVAILRYRLYDIDRVISRTIAYGVVTGLLVGVDARVSILALGAVLGQVTGNDTLLVAVSHARRRRLFQPVRRRVQRVVDRRFDRARYDAERNAAGVRRTAA